MSERSKLTAALLAIFLGGIGLHKFYLGQIGMGILYLLFCWTFIPAVIGLIEGIVLLSISDETFARRYGGASGPPPNTHVICPDCRELVFAEARVCKHCGCRLIPMGRAAG